VIKRHLHLAFRTLLKSKIISAVNIIGLAIGLTAAILMILWVENELSFDRHYKSYKQTFLVMTGYQGIGGTAGTSNRQPYILGKIASTEITTIKQITRLAPVGSNVVMRVENRSFYENEAAYIDEHWFEIFDQKIIAGDVASFFDNPFSIILIKKRAKEIFGNIDAVGKMILIDSNQYMVRAVVENNRPNSTFQYAMFLPVAAELIKEKIKKASVSWKRSSYHTFITLEPDADTSKLTSALSAIRNRQTDNKNHEQQYYSLLPIKDLHFNITGGATDLPHGNKQTVVIFSLLATLILVSACINYVNLTTAGAIQRSKDVGIRKLIGARKHQLFLQFLLESIVATIIAMAIALVTVQLVIPVFNNLIEIKSGLIIFQGKFWLITGVTTIIVIILNGVYPALFLSSFKPLQVLKGIGFFRTSNVLLRKGLVVVQFSFSFVLITGTIVLSKQLQFINQRDSGFNRSLVFQMPMPNAAFANMDPARQESMINHMRLLIAGDASVKAVSVATPGIGNTKVFFTDAVLP
jgi:putative ABC transport system permease protein